MANQTSGNQLDAWTYDTAQMTGPGTARAYGLLASATSYIGGTTGEAYAETVNSYDPADNPISTSYTIPSDSLTGQLAGTYTFGASYNPNGSQATQTYAAAGSLPQETVTYGYDNLGYLYTTWGTEPDGTILPGYVWNAFYTDEDQIQEIDLAGTQAAPFDRIIYNYNPIGQLAEERVQQQPTTSWIPVDDTSYTYDKSGNVLTAGDSVTGEYQCYAYDYLARLTAAWSQNSACPASPSTPPGGSGIGGPAPYQQTLSYDNTAGANGTTNGTTGDITGDTLITGTGTGQTTTATTFSYPGYGNPQPHAPSSEQTSVNGGTATTTTLNFAGTGDPPGYLAAAGGATYQWNGPSATPGQLFSVTSPGNTTSYRYDASGNLLLVRDSATGNSTLYLPGEEVTAHGSTVTATRYYTFNGQIVAARTNLNDITWLATDPQGTATTAIDGNIPNGGNAQNVSHRYYTPFGDLLATTGTATWPGTRSYVGGTSDPSTGLDNLGAREYNPAAPAFISPDPVLDPANPTDLNPYDYAYNNPVTGSDPTGLFLPSENGTCQGDPWCSSAADSNPPLNLTDLGEGAIDALYNTGLGILSLAAYGQGNPEAALQISSLPEPFANTDPDNPSFRVGYGGTLALGLLIPGDDQAPTAGLGIDLSSDLTRAADASPAGSEAAELANPGKNFAAEASENSGEQTVAPAPEAGGAATSDTAANAAGNTTRVGRWMSQREFDQMSSTGRVVEGAGGRAYVISPPDPAAYPSAANGSIYAEFDVPSDSLVPGSKPNWWQILGPNLQTRIFGPPPLEMPPATCIEWVCAK